MNRLSHAIGNAVAQLEKQKLEFALIGGLAVSARTEPRFTRDADFAVAVSTDQEAEAAVRQFLQAGYRVVSTVEQDAVGRLATVRLSRATAESPDVVVDLLFASSGIEREIVEAADRFEILDKITVPVCTIGHLLALKILSQDENSRPQDAADIKSLLEAADETELTRAREAVQLITRRGYHRERDLVAALESAIKRMRSVVR